MNKPRIHSTSKPLILDKNRRYIQDDKDITNKPQGLWYSFGDEWIKWTIDSNHKVGKYFYRINIGASNILTLSTESQIDLFVEKYKSNKLNKRYDKIDWSQVVSEYDGIEVYPFIPHYKMRSSYTWHCGLDVASGCIWNLSDVSANQCDRIL